MEVSVLCQSFVNLQAIVGGGGVERLFRNLQ